jgi:hypothetical protein
MARVLCTHACECVRLEQFQEMGYWLSGSAGPISIQEDPSEG